jgi:succinoglycan biosynthesis protein ExoM
MNSSIQKVPEISICIITYKRATLLAGLLTNLEGLETDGLFRRSVVVVDNDRQQSAKEVVLVTAASSAMRIVYDVEPEQNLSLARNRSVRNATGEFVAFIDDDELPPPRWLIAMFNTLQRHQVDGVLGPVYPEFAAEPPKWLVKSGVADRPLHKTGHQLDWDETRSGNVLLKREVFEGPDSQFDPAFGSHGEDRDFFRRVIAQGRRFVWCAEAAVPEIQPTERLRRRYYLRRALLRGSVSWNQSPGFGLLVKTIVALVVYIVMLPALLLIGQGQFMRYVVKICDHAGRLMSACGIKVEKCLRFLD